MSSSLFNVEEVPTPARIRWLVKRGDSIVHNRGFRSKAEASTWILNLGNRLDWRVGFIFRLRGDTVDMSIVDKDGNIARV